VKHTWSRSDKIAIVALVVAMPPFIDWVLNFWGDVAPLPPSAYAIIRGTNNFPSDHLVFPFEWSNTTNDSVLVRRPELHLYEASRTTNNNGPDLTFFLAGTYPAISSADFHAGHALANAFVLQPDSVTSRVLLFQVSGWWNEESPLYRFRFQAKKRYRVVLRYTLNLETQHNVNLFDFPVFDSVADLQEPVPDRVGQWDYWLLEPRQE
jgi:hypothetical protein